MEIDGDAPGSGHDQIVVDGTLSLGGTLGLAFGPGVTPVVGDSWILFIAGVLGGDFTDVVAPGHEGLRFGLLPQGSNGILTVQPVPLPGGIVLLPGALLLYLSRRNSVPPMTAAMSELATNRGCPRFRRRISRDFWP